MLQRACYIHWVLRCHNFNTAKGWVKPSLDREYALQLHAHNNGLQAKNPHQRTPTAEPGKARPRAESRCYEAYVAAVSTSVYVRSLSVKALSQCPRLNLDSQVSRVTYGLHSNPERQTTERSCHQPISYREQQLLNLMCVVHLSS